VYNYITFNRFQTVFDIWEFILGMRKIWISLERRKGVGKTGVEFSNHTPKAIKVNYLEAIPIEKT
jgi:hypothetical protein